eukprot:m.240870 g.240870  ORF g.240870 m.240870 type:complete len:471 (+) comp40197_c1_seq25:28-1440(+)
MSSNNNDSETSSQHAKSCGLSMTQEVEHFRFVGVFSAILLMACPVNASATGASNPWPCNLRTGIVAHGSTYLQNPSHFLEGHNLAIDCIGTSRADFYKDNTQINTNHARWRQSGYRIFLSSATKRDSGRYHCKAVIKGRRCSSKAATVYVSKDCPKLACYPRDGNIYIDMPRSTKKGANLTVCIENPEDVGPLSSYAYAWDDDNQFLNNLDFDEKTYGNCSSFLIRPTRKDLSGRFTFLLRSSSQEFNAQKEFNISQHNFTQPSSAPPIKYGKTKQDPEIPLLSALTPKYQRLVPGSSLTLMVNITNFEQCKPFAVVWNNAKNQSPIKKPHIQSQRNGSLLLLKYSQVNKDDAGEISVTVFNAVGQTRVPFNLFFTVSPPPSVSVAVKVPTNSPFWTAKVPNSTDSIAVPITHPGTQNVPVSGASRLAPWNGISLQSVVGMQMPLTFIAVFAFIGCWAKEIIGNNNAIDI